MLNKNDLIKYAHSLTDEPTAKVIGKGKSVVVHYQNGRRGIYKYAFLLASMYAYFNHGLKIKSYDDLYEIEDDSNYEFINMIWMCRYSSFNELAECVDNFKKNGGSL